MPIVLVEGEFLLHLLDRDHQLLDHVLAHGVVHLCQISLHLVQHGHVLQVHLVLGLLFVIFEPSFLLLLRAGEHGGAAARFRGEA